MKIPKPWCSDCKKQIEKGPAYSRNGGWLCENCDEIRINEAKAEAKRNKLMAKELRDEGGENFNH